MRHEDLQPVNGAHSIKNVFFALEWENPLSTKDFQDIAKLHPNVAAQYSRVQFSKAITVKFDDGKTSTDVADISGVIFDNNEDYGNVVSTIQVQPNNMVVNLSGTSYENWSQAWKKVSSSFAALLPAIIVGRAINVVGLQYVDEFIVNVPQNEVDCSDLFLHNSKYLSPAVLQSKGLWHCHQGFFEKFDTPIAYKCLNNINISVMDVLGKNTLQIIMSHRAILDEHISEINDSAFKKDAPIVAIMRALHDFDVETLKQLLRVEVLSKIGLGN